MLFSFWGEALLQLDLGGDMGPPLYFCDIDIDLPMEVDPGIIIFVPQLLLFPTDNVEQKHIIFKKSKRIVWLES